MCHNEVVRSVGAVRYVFLDIVCDKMWQTHACAHSTLLLRFRPPTFLKAYVVYHTNLVVGCQVTVKVVAQQIYSS